MQTHPPAELLRLCAPSPCPVPLLTGGVGVDIADAYFTFLEASAPRGRMETLMGVG